MATDLEEKKNEEQDKQKYEILYQKDLEITKFIETFEATRKQVYHCIADDIKIKYSIKGN